MIVHLALALAFTPAQPPPPDKWLGSDKLKHFFVAAFTESVVYSALQAARIHHNSALAGAWAVTGAVSVMKEVHDHRSYGLFSVKDLVWDAAGAGAATLLLDRAVRTPNRESEQAAASFSLAHSGGSLLSVVVPPPILPSRVKATFAPRR